MLQSAS